MSSSPESEDEVDWRGAEALEGKEPSEGKIPRSPSPSPSSSCAILLIESVIGPIWIADGELSPVVVGVCGPADESEEVDGRLDDFRFSVGVVLPSESMLGFEVEGGPFEVWSLS